MMRYMALCVLRTLSALTGALRTAISIFIGNLVAAFLGVNYERMRFLKVFSLIFFSAKRYICCLRLAFLDQGESFSIGSILTPIFLFAIIVITALSFAAIPIRKRHGGLSITEVTSRGL